MGEAGPRLSDLAPQKAHFHGAEEVLRSIQDACGTNPDIATFHELGASREGRPIYGVTLGHGPRLATLVAGAHADEPVGPETLRTLITELLAHRDWLADDGGFADLLQRWTFRIIPHINPDGDARNRSWMTEWPDVGAYIAGRVREQPGDDLEFGYPAMRPENRLASGFLFDYTPIALHLSMHGMGFSEGALLLIERRGVDRAARLMERWRGAVGSEGLRLHDHDRAGEKGFRYLGPGFWTTPESTAMRRHFIDQGDQETAAKFFPSSMEWACLTGYDPTSTGFPLALVTELPLFVVGRDYERRPGVPSAYLELLQRLPEWRRRLEDGESIREEIDAFRIEPLPLETAIRLQLTAIELGIEAAERE